MISRLAHITSKILLFPVNLVIYSSHLICNQRVVALPDTKITKTIRKQKKQTNDFPGIYVVKYGRSKQVFKRLSGYRGYQEFGDNIECLLLLEVEDHKRLEKELHRFASDQGLQRLGRKEIFICEQQEQFISTLMEFVSSTGIPYKIITKRLDHFNTQPNCLKNPHLRKKNKFNLELIKAEDHQSSELNFYTTNCIRIPLLEHEDTDNYQNEFQVIYLQNEHIFHHTTTQHKNEQNQDSCIQGNTFSRINR